MNNLEPMTQLNPNEIPDGFTTSSAQNPGGAAGNNAAALKKQQMEEQKQAILEQALSQEALARLGRIKLVKAEKAMAVENHIVSLAIQGKLPGKINEPKLIELLEKGSRAAAEENGGAGPNERISIQRKKYAFDEDSDDDDNDDDLL